MDYRKVEKRIEDYVTDLFDQMHSPHLVFHNLAHTKKVVKHAEEIAAHYNVSDRELMILLVAAWFHDSGYLFAEPSKNEEMSCDVMKKFVKGLLNDEQAITEIEGCIMATKFPREPKNLLEQILCDADTYNFGTGDFKETNKRAQEEFMLKDDTL